MQVLEYLLSTNETLRRAYGVVSAARGESNSAAINVGASRGDDAASKAGLISMIVLGVLVVVVIVAVIAVVIVRRRRRRSTYYGTHVDFSPEHPSREVRLDADRRPEFSDINGDFPADGNDPAIVMELDDVEIVDDEKVKKGTDDPEYYSDLKGS